MMFYSHKFNQNLVGHLIIAGLLVFISQSTAENECQKDPIKTGQELLASAQTLFYGENSERFDSDMAIKLVKKYSVGVLCCQNIEPKFGINANFKNLQNNFCQQLKNGKNMEEASGNAESSAINLMQNLNKPKILQNIRQKIAKNSFLDEKNREKMAQLLGQFQIGLDKFYGVIKARLNVAHSRDEADHSNGGNALRQHQRRRRKRMRTLEAATGRLSSAFSTENPRPAEPIPQAGVKVCVVLFVMTACTIGTAIFLAITGLSHAPMKIALLAFLVAAFLVMFAVFIWQCIVNKL